MADLEHGIAALAAMPSMTTERNALEEELKKKGLKQRAAS